MGAPKLCTVCGKPDGKACACCNAASYCSKDCQKQDWPSHKLLCNTFKDFSEQSRPSPSHLRAIHFPVDASKPVFIWVNFAHEEKADINGCHNKPALADMKTLCATPVEVTSGQGADLSTEHICKFVKSSEGQETRRKVEILDRINSDSDGSAKNKAMTAAMKAHAGTKYSTLCGPLVLLAKEGPDRENMAYVDIDLDHLRMFVDNKATGAHYCSDSEIKVQLRASGRWVSFEQAVTEMRASPNWTELHERRLVDGMQMWRSFWGHQQVAHAQETFKNIDLSVGNLILG